MRVQELEAEISKLSKPEQAHLFESLALLLQESESELTVEELEQRWADFEASGRKGGVEASVFRAQINAQYGMV